MGKTSVTTVITGATSGIGRAIAMELAHRGHNLILTGRDGVELKKTREAALLLGAGQVVETVADLSTELGTESLWQFIGQSQQTVTGIVHCAGQGWIGSFDQMPETMIGSLNQLLVMSPLILTRRLLGVWGTQRSGRILLVSSTAAYQAGPGAGVYYSFKAAVHRWAVALQSELRGSPISLTLACPGAVSSQFSIRAGKAPLLWARSPEYVAQIVVRAWERGTWRVVPGWENRLLLALTRLLPEPWMARLVRGSQRPAKN